MHIGLGDAVSLWLIFGVQSTASILSQQAASPSTPPDPTTTMLTQTWACAVCVSHQFNLHTVGIVVGVAWRVHVVDAHAMHRFGDSVLAST